MAALPVVRIELTRKQAGGCRPRHSAAVPSVMEHLKIVPHVGTVTWLGVSLSRWIVRRQLPTHLDAPSAA